MKRNRVQSVSGFGKLLLVLLLLAGTQTIFAQGVKETLFQEANASLKSADEAQAKYLSPKNYSQAIKLHREAESEYDRGKNLDNIRKKLKASVAYFNKAIEATKLAEVTLNFSIKARQDALKANADKYTQILWDKGEEKFREAAMKLEDGNVNNAKKKSSEAEALFRQAELEAIKANYLNETRALLDAADKQKVKDRAPLTLERARSLVAKAEQELEENRYDKDVARSLAQQAKYEAKHALYLAQKINAFKKEKKDLEDLLLEAEMPLQAIASAMDAVAEFDEGYDKPADNIIDYIRTKQDQVERLTQDLADRDQQIVDLKARITEMESQLGVIAQEQSALKERIEAQERIRQQFATVEKMFDREEARVFRQKNDVILRLVGLNFAVNKAVIEPKYFSLLTRVQNAINTFPESRLTIEGHTDSHGSDNKNLELSQERAEAVRQYLLANMSNINRDQIDAVGYGENKPIANNETREGRAKNRRIDIVIHPDIATESE